MAQIDTPNSLLSFMSAATNNIQQALSKQGKIKKVNHRKYILKRLKTGKRARNNTKPKVLANSAMHATQGSMPWDTATYHTEEYPRVPKESYPQPDFDLDELLQSLDSPSQYSAGSSPSSSHTYNTATLPSNLATTNLYDSFDMFENHCSPPSDFSDSAYSSPRASPPSSYPYSRNPSPICSSQVYGSCEWVQMPVYPQQQLPHVDSFPSGNELLCYFPQENL